MPPVMMTWVTPTAMMPMTETCRIITVRRCWLNRKLWPTKIQPRTSKDQGDAEQDEKDADSPAASAGGAAGSSRHALRIGLFCGH